MYPLQKGDIHLVNLIIFLSMQFYFSDQILVTSIMFTMEKVSLVEWRKYVARYVLGNALTTYWTILSWEEKGATIMVHVIEVNFFVTTC